VRENWRLVLPLVILYVIGIAGFWAPLYIPPIAALVTSKVNESWLGFAGNIIGAIGTLIAAAVAWLVVQQQLDAQAEAAEVVRKKKEFAARAVLPLSLSALHDYARGCVEAIERLPDSCPIGTTVGLPAVPLDDVKDIRAALEHMGDEPASQLSATLKFLQIQNARLPSLEEEAQEGFVSALTRQRRLIDAIDLVGLIDRSFEYARGAEFKAPRLSTDEFNSAFRKYAHFDVSNYLIIEGELRFRDQEEQ
jgi:hypothetical protein